MLFEKEIPAAVLCWYKASGEIVPKIFKIQPDERNAEVLTYNIDQIVHSEEKYHFGSKYIDFTCHVAGQVVHLSYHIQDHQWGFFPAFGVAWIPSKERFIVDNFSGWLSFLMQGSISGENLQERLP